jgi:hypothetical protein
MLGTVLKEIVVWNGECEWLFVLHHYHLPHLTTKHTVVMFTVIVVSWPHTLACDIRHSFPVNCTYSQMLSFRCHSCLVKSVLNMDRNAFWEYINMRLILGKAYGTGAAAVRLYTKRYAQRRLPKPRTFHTTDHPIRETGTLCPSTVDHRRRTSARTVYVEKRTLRPAPVEYKLPIMWRTRTAAIPVSFTTAQAVSPLHFRPRQKCCQWFFRKHGDGPFVSSHVLFTDEAEFTRNGLLISITGTLGVTETHLSTIQSRHKKQFAITVWAGIVGHCFVGPYVLPHRLNGAAYQHCLHHTMLELLDTVPLHIRQTCIMHDGVPDIVGPGNQTGCILLRVGNLAD